MGNGREFCHLSSSLSIMKIFLGLGSNLGEREANLVVAKDLLMKHNVLVIGQSQVLETDPLGGIDQPKYLNQVVECQTELAPRDLLFVCKSIEKEMGRPVQLPMTGVVKIGGGRGDETKAMDDVDAEGGRAWQSRIIDIDILLYENTILDEPDLQIPHSGIMERPFVLAGLCELDPNLVHPKLNISLQDSLRG